VKQTSKNIVLIGAGRMGQIHLLGLKKFSGSISIVDINPKCCDAIKEFTRTHNCAFDYKCYTALEEVPRDSNFFAAILSSTADARLKQLDWILNNNIRFLLLEKPVAQSRKIFKDILSRLRSSNIDVRCNFYRRKLSYFNKIRSRILESNSEMPLTLLVSSGAMGLGCNGIHWIDFVAYLSNAKSGRLAYGKVDKTLIESGRGPQFKDYGGIAVYEFDTGARLVLNIVASSSAPTSFLLYESSHATIVDQKNDLAIEYARVINSEKPNYLYGMDYMRNEESGAETFEISLCTTRWLDYITGHGRAELPTVEDVILSHNLLFDLLETSGNDEFLFT